MAASQSLFFFFLVISFAIVTISSSKRIPAVTDGFTVEIFHQDSPKSPLYNPSETHYQRVANSLRRNRLLATADSAATPLRNNRGEFLMELSLGSPPFKILGIPDTGSNVIWTQCLPCTTCYQQNYPLFDPRNSATYRKIPCSSPLCKYAGRALCSPESNCQYSIIYSDTSHSNGDIAVDTITVGPVSFPNIVIGCGHDNSGTFEKNVSGIIGFGRGPGSLVSQMGVLGKRFSYCFAPIYTESLASSKLNFGSSAIVSGAGALSTPAFARDAYSYWLTLEAISVGGRRLEFQDPSIPAGDGNIIIDSGTTITMLPANFYKLFAAAVSDAIKLTRVNDPSGFHLESCFKIENNDLNSVPAITAHFKGADLRLSLTNAFIRVRDDVLCLAFLPIPSGPAIYGNVVHSNFLTGYDSENLVVSFKPADCASM